MSPKGSALILEVSRFSKYRPVQQDALYKYGPSKAAKHLEILGKYQSKTLKESLKKSKKDMPEEARTMAGLRCSAKQARAAAGGTQEISVWEFLD